MAIGDAAYIKKINRSQIISKIIEQGMVSRADLSKITKLTRATISVQVADLLEEELLVESQQEHTNVGRKPIMLSLNRRAGYALGIDLDFRSISFTVTDLSGSPVKTDRVVLESSNYDDVLEILINQIRGYQSQYSHSRFRIVGIVIGIHGIVKNDKTISFVTQHKWYDKDLKGDLERNLHTEIHVENNANLCSFAEKVYTRHQSENLVSVSMYSGIGLGILINGEQLKGYHGYAGEMGHMIIIPDGKPCNCGNLGCWELYASENSFLKQLAESLNNPLLSYDEVEDLIHANNPVVMAQIDEFLKYIAIGLNNIINLLNPETLVLNSELLKLIPNAESKIKSNFKSSISDYKELLISELGTNASVMGACALSIKNFLEIQELRFTIENDDYE
ncbi:ROK family protein [Litchfieldia salsa]|uniref:Sugar kinase of the NBD/HSP70 family, may contain an N-terminal HTH domain n=1 Tax=Litchfieldia salsa TaxID=930152 RepID=A0A1H0VM01_9BACI|nr:ROK family protein [Litchfieldia salsa]SDP79311.1 Sugar kinase of the NBD/HSP70 family, may contain an N-terminal HTH domain [Litchfieldia salsa]